MTTTPSVASRRIYAGLFLVTLATVMYEIVLTRIFSVTMWYHFAFVAISIAMFGMTVGALIVYLRPAWFPAERLTQRLGVSALLFGLTVVGSFLTHLVIPFTIGASLVALWSVMLTYVAIAVPFVWSGICVCLILTRFPRQLDRLYATDLVGAAAGCLLVILVIDRTDGPTTVVAIGTLAALGAACFLTAADSQPLRVATLGVVVLLALFVAANAILIARQTPLIRLQWVKGKAEERPLYEKWNSFSRLTVHGDPGQPLPPQGWGMSPTTPHREVPQLLLLMDASAGSWLIRFDGRMETIEYLRYDVINLPHHLRPDARVLVIGTGGGRDVLSALLFRQKSVVGVEINGDIIDLVNEEFGSFTGFLDRQPAVRFVNDEARSYMARQAERFDIVQISLIDTWAATGAGAFVLSEHSLYTTEAWRLFLDRLTPRGVLAVSRYYVDGRPDEAYRLVSLAAAALNARGARNPRDHILMVRHVGQQVGNLRWTSVATILVSPTPFSGEDVDLVERVSRRLQFPVVLSPRASVDETFAAIASGKDVSALYAAFPVNIAAPTDDNPFFFHTLRLRDLLRGAWRGFDPAGRAINTNAVWVLGMLLITVLILTTLCVVVPLGLTADRAALRGAGPLFVFFAGIGLGFMLIEISQMQRLIIFLGHPTYGLSVVLFAMLLSSGIGSLLSGAVAGVGRRVAAPLVALVGVLAVFGVVTPLLIRTFDAATTPMRIAVAVAILFPIGLLMGMAFPLGMRLASTGAPALTPWLWGVNGATSVCASVLAVAIALNAGISASFWTGVACYVAAAVAFGMARARPALSWPAGG
jgi:hypothetical protein